MKSAAAKKISIWKNENIHDQTALLIYREGRIQLKSWGIQLKRWGSSPPLLPLKLSTV